MSHKFRLKKTDETRNYFFEELKPIELINKKRYNSQLYWTGSYFSFHNYWMYFNFYFCVFGIPIRIIRSAKGLKMYAIPVRTKN